MKTLLSSVKAGKTVRTSEGKTFKVKKNRKLKASEKNLTHNITHVATLENLKGEVIELQYNARRNVEVVESK